MEQFHDAKVLNTRLPSFVIPKIVKHETRIKDAVNMDDLICLLATVRTLKQNKLFNSVCITSFHEPFDAFLTSFHLILLNSI